VTEILYFLRTKAATAFSAS